MKRILSAAFFFTSSILLAGCTTDTGANDDAPANADATRVFNTAKGSANSATLLGIWEGAKPQTAGPITLTSRFEFRADFVVTAAKCTREGVEPVIVGGRSTATVSADLIQTNQAVSDQRSIGSDAACQARSSAGVIPACDPNTAPAQRTICFELTGTTLDIYQGSAGIQSMVKIAD